MCMSGLSFKVGERDGEPEDILVSITLSVRDVDGHSIGDPASKLALRESMTWCISSILTSSSPFSLLCILSICSATGSIVVSRRDKDRLEIVSVYTTDTCDRDRPKILSLPLSWIRQGARALRTLCIAHETPSSRNHWSNSYL